MVNRRELKEEGLMIPKQRWAAFLRLDMMVFAFATAIALFTSTTAQAGWWNAPPGCYICEPDYYSTTYQEHCRFPNSGSQGTTKCATHQAYNGAPIYCFATGYVCEYDCFGPGCDSGGGGTGGGGTGGGGDECGGDAYCPPSCFDCGNIYY